MAIERYSNGKNLKGFRLAENREAEIMERALGISFPEKPKAVELSLWNKIVLGFKERWRYIFGRRAFYHPEYHAYFVKKKDDFIVRAHENMHGFNAKINPELFRPEARHDIEQTIAYLCFDQGLSDWASLETAESLRDPYLNERANAIKRNRFGRSAGAIPQDNPFNDRFMNNVFDELNRYMNDFRSYVSAGNKRRASRTWNYINEVSYYAGYYYVYKILEGYKAKGAEIGNAIIEIIKNPPRTINDLRNPQNYLARRFLAEARAQAA